MSNVKRELMERAAEYLFLHSQTAAYPPGACYALNKAVLDMANELDTEFSFDEKECQRRRQHIAEQYLTARKLLKKIMAEGWLANHAYWLGKISRSKIDVDRRIYALLLAARFYKDFQ